MFEIGSITSVKTKIPSHIYPLAYAMKACGFVEVKYKSKFKQSAHIMKHGLVGTQYKIVSAKYLPKN